MDHYEILKIKEEEFTVEVLKKSYMELSLIHDPDKQLQRGIEKIYNEKFERIQLAYKTLSDPEKKRLYDQGLNARRLAQPGVIDQVVELYEFLAGDDDEGEGFYTFPCRCEGYYVIEDVEGIMKEIELGLRVLIKCSSCSLLVEIEN